MATEALRILIVGAGATGGALGTRLLEAGRDVTFLVRQGRAAALAGNGLRFVAPDGDRRHPVKTIIDTDGVTPFDLVFVAVKAPAIPAVLKSMAGAIGPDTVIIPILNGLDHLEASGIHETAWLGVTSTSLSCKPVGIRDTHYRNRPRPPAGRPREAASFLRAGPRFLTPQPFDSYVAGAKESPWLAAYPDSKALTPEKTTTGRPVTGRPALSS